MWTFASVPACSQQAIFHSDHIIFSKCCFSQLRISCHGTETKYWLHPVHVSERARPVCIFCALPNNSHGILEIRPLAHQAKLSCLDRTQTFVFLTNCAARCSENTSRTLFAAYLCPPLLNTPTIVAYAGRGRGEHIYGWIRSGQCKTHVKRRPDNVWTM